MAAAETRHALLKVVKDGKKYMRKKRTLWSYYFEGNVEIPEICIDSLNLQCIDEREGCSRLHSQQAWHWQVLHRNEWFNFTRAQSDRLERAYQNVDTEEVVIYALDPQTTGKQGQELIELLGTERWRADFNFMKIMKLDYNASYQIRRLSTPSAAKVKSDYATEYRWYFKQNDCWVEFGLCCENEDSEHVVSAFAQSQTTSREIEKKYHKNNGVSMTVNVLNGKYRLNFAKMQLINKPLKKLIPVRRRAVNSDVKYPTIWSYHIRGDVDIPEVCLDTVDETCSHENGCGKLHAKDSWQWQLMHNEVWYNLPKTQARSLERAYLDVWMNDVEMPEIYPTKMGRIGVVMETILGTTKWLAQFDSLTLTKLNHEGNALKIRRLSTPSSLAPCAKTTKFVWFYRNEDNIWVEFGCTSSVPEATTLLCLQTSSYDIEKCFLSGKWDTMDVTIMGTVFELNFSFMSLRDCSTQEEMPVRRRPEYARSNRIYSRILGLVPLSATSKEYQEVKVSLLLSLEQPEVVKINRIQNPDIWNVFMQRQAQISELHHSDETLNIHTLFQWVKEEAVESIRINNITWNQQCPEIQKLCNKGVCFFRSAEFLHTSCTSSATVKNHKLIVFKVLVGKIQEDVGSSGDCWTKVDNCFLPNKFCKYDPRDFCPAYIIEF